MSPHQQRVVDEKVALDTKLAALTKFMFTPLCFNLPLDERSLLKQQGDVMREYSALLEKRIALFEVAA